MDGKRGFLAKHRWLYLIYMTLLLAFIFFVFAEMSQQQSFTWYVGGFVYLYFIYHFHVTYSSLYSARMKYVLKLWPLAVLGSMVGTVLVVFLAERAFEAPGFPDSLVNNNAFYLFILMLLLTIYGIFRVISIIRNYHGNFRITDDRISFTLGEDRDDLFFANVMSIAVTRQGIVHVANDKRDAEVLVKWAESDGNDSKLNNQIKDLPLYICFSGEKFVEALKKEGFEVAHKLNATLLKKIKG